VKPRQSIARRGRSRANRSPGAARRKSAGGKCSIMVAKSWPELENLPNRAGIGLPVRGLATILHLTSM